MIENIQNERTHMNPFFKTCYFWRQRGKTRNIVKVNM